MATPTLAMLRDACKISCWSQRLTVTESKRSEIGGRLTRRAHAQAKVDGIPDHGPVCYREKRLGTLIRIGGKGRERRSWSAENEGLEPGCGHRHGMGHCGGELRCLFGTEAWRDRSRRPWRRLCWTSLAALRRRWWAPSHSWILVGWTGRGWKEFKPHVQPAAFAHVGSQPLGTDLQCPPLSASPRANSLGGHALLGSKLG